jgi:L-malate glycosyltransferase
LKEKRHILFLAEWFPNPDDPQLGIFIAKHAIAASKYSSVTVLYVHSSADVIQKFDLHIEEKEYKLIRVAYKKTSNPLMGIMRYRKAFSLGLKHCGIPDLVHLQVCGKNVIARKLFLKRIPFVITEHWSGFLKTGNKFLTNESLIRKTFSHSLGISVPSEYLKQAIAKKMKTEKITVIPNVIEKSSLPLVKPSIPRVLFVGDMVDEIKNISGILEALDKIKNENPLQADFIGDGPDFEWLKEKAESIKNGIKISFHGRKPNEEVLIELKKSTFLVVNSRIETFSMITAEALLAGIPVIATRCGGPEELINKDNGILIPVNDTTALSTAIENMIIHHHRYNPDEISKVMENKYSMETIATRLEEFYQVSLKMKR